MKCQKIYQYSDHVVASTQLSTHITHHVSLEYMFYMNVFPWRVLSVNLKNEPHLVPRGQRRQENWDLSSSSIKSRTHSGKCFLPKLKRFHK